MNSYDTEIFSKCSPQVYDILQDTTSMTPPLLEFYKNAGEVAYDKNKQYTHILLTCDKYGWPVYMPTDEVEVFDTVIETGRYWVNATGDAAGFALHGNGWYCDSVVEKSVTIRYYQIKRY